MTSTQKNKETHGRINKLIKHIQQIHASNEESSCGIAAKPKAEGRAGSNKKPKARSQKPEAKSQSQPPKKNQKNATPIGNPKNRGRQQCAQKNIQDMHISKAYICLASQTYTSDVP